MCQMESEEQHSNQVVDKLFAPVSAMGARVSSTCETMRHVHREPCWFRPVTAPSWRKALGVFNAT